MQDPVAVFHCLVRAACFTSVRIAAFSLLFFLLAAEPVILAFDMGTLHQRFEFFDHLGMFAGNIHRLADILAEIIQLQRTVRILADVQPYGLPIAFPDSLSAALLIEFPV